MYQFPQPPRTSADLPVPDEVRDHLAQRISQALADAADEDAKVKENQAALVYLNKIQPELARIANVLERLERLVLATRLKDLSMTEPLLTKPAVPLPVSKPAVVSTGDTSQDTVTVWNRALQQSPDGGQQL